MTIPSHSSRFTPPTEEQQAQWAQQRARWDAEQAHAKALREAMEPIRRRVIEAGPPLRDVDAAMQCLRDAHPKLSYDYDGGTTCPCQDTPEEAEARKAERKAAAKELLGLFRGEDSDEDREARWAREREALKRVADELGVEVHTCSGAAPFQIEAVVDGRSFYLRDRHERFTIDVASAQRPMAFVDDEPGGFEGAVTIDSGASWVIYEGEDHDGEDETQSAELRALRYAVTKVRDWQRQQSCSHVLTNERGTIQFRFCPICGIRTQDVTGFTQ